MGKRKERLQKVFGALGLLAILSIPVGLVVYFAGLDSAFEAFKLTAYLAGVFALVGVAAALLHGAVYYAVRNQRGKLFQVTEILQFVAAFVCGFAVLLGIAELYRDASAWSIATVASSAAYVAFYQYQKREASHSTDNKEAL